MARRCTICDHPQCEAINHALVNNAPLHPITLQYSLTIDAVKWHKRKHLSGLLAKGKEAQKEAAIALAEVADEKEQQEAAQGDGLLSQLRELITRTERIYQMAEDSGDLRTALTAIRESRGNLELLGKLIGELSDGVNVNIYTNPVWIELKALMLITLEPYPEAKGAVINALARSC